MTASIRAWAILEDLTDNQTRLIQKLDAPLNIVESSWFWHGARIFAFVYIFNDRQRSMLELAGIIRRSNEVKNLMMIPPIYRFSNV